MRKMLGVLMGVFFICILTGCNNGSDSADPVYEVFIGGSLGARAVYWIDGEEVPLCPDYSSSVYSLDVEGADVYAAGYINNPGQLACYWKNGEQNMLNAPSGTVASAICVHEGVPYSTGYNSGAHTLYRWEGTEYTWVTAGPGSDIETHDIHVDDGIVYIAGHYDDGTNFTACYWMNRARVDLVTGDSGTQANALVKHDEDIYVAGTENFPPGDRRACLWKNGQKYILHEGTNTAALDVFVKGNDVYVAGQYHDGAHTNACYWKNGVRFDVADETANTSATGIHVTDEHVYVSGIYPGGTAVWYWVDGEKIVVDDGGGYVWDIFIRESPASSEVP
jgi:hypothetical protein